MLVPAPLERARHDPILGLHGHVLALGAPRFALPARLLVGLARRLFRTGLSCNGTKRDVNLGL